MHMEKCYTTKYLWNKIIRGIEIREKFHMNLHKMFEIKNSCRQLIYKMSSGYDSFPPIIVWNIFLKQKCPGDSKKGTVLSFGHTILL